MTKEKLLYYCALGLSRLPMWMLYGVSSAAAWAMYRLKAYRYKVVTHNLDIALPELGETERRDVARRFYRYFTDTVVQTLKLMTASDAWVRRHVDFAGWEQLDRPAAEGQPVVLYLGHYGNWEMVSSIVWVIPERYKCCQIYKSQHNSLGHTIMYRIRHRYDVENVTQKQAFRTLLSYQRAGIPTITGFIADQRPNGKQTHWLRFLGLPTAIVVGGEEIGRRIGATYFYIDVSEPRRGHWRYTLKPVIPVEGEEYPYTAGYFHMFEQTIRRDPRLWLWSHKRWAGQEDHQI